MSFRRSSVLVYIFVFFILQATGVKASERGEKEVKQLIADRPSIRPILIENGVVWNWLVDAFSKNINWVSQAPASERWHYPNYHSLNQDGTIDVHVSGISVNEDGSVKKLSGQEVLASVVFEIFNSSHKDVFIALAKRVKAKNISRDDFIREMSRTEHASCLQEQMFYVTIWLPYCEAHHIDSCPKFWKYPTTQDFDTWLASFPRSGYPWDIYGNYYDSQTGADRFDAPEKLTLMSTGHDWEASNSSEKKRFCVEMAAKFGREAMLYQLSLDSFYDTDDKANLGKTLINAMASMKLVELR